MYICLSPPPEFESQSIRFNEFDHKFFGISEAEADYMDPQHKLLLQCAYRALEDAGIPMEKISGTRTGVYIGACYFIHYLTIVRTI